MRYHSILIFKKHYRIVPSLENLCNIESETGLNLLKQVKPEDLNLRFMRSLMKNLIEDEQGNHIDIDTLNRLYSEDVGVSQQVFLECYRCMYDLPKNEDTAIKKVIRRLKKGGEKESRP